MYGKLFESTFTGSMYGKGAVVFATWAYAIAHTKPDGLVELNQKLLAGMIGCDEKEISAAIDFLCSPDPKSRTKTESGRRLIQEGEYIYRTVNYSLYNSVRNEPQRREYNRIKKRESRARIAARQTKSNGQVKPSQAGQPTHTQTHTQTQRAEEAAAAALEIPECPRDMDAASEHRAFENWCDEHSHAPSLTRWRRWVLRAKESGRYAKQKPRPPTEAEIRAERNRIALAQEAN